MDRPCPDTVVPSTDPPSSRRLDCLLLPRQFDHEARALSRFGSYLNFSRKPAAIRHGLQRVVADVPEDLAHFIGIDCRHDWTAWKDPPHMTLGRKKWMVFQQEKRLIQQINQIHSLKLKALLASIHQKIRNQLIQAA